MKITMTFTLLLLVSFLSTGQNYSNDNVEKVKSEETNSNISSEELSSNDKEWDKIQIQIQKNKRKYSKSKNLVYAKIMMDTIHVDVTIFKEKSSLSEW
ncbi:hypothetical protein D1816_11895 [Aquimarina sp. AD10]|uniref:hypothetical protein n=1 Tax=Aquimarina sp. AD10 TaxID=1714849 RepID=UPI000E4D9DD1|nr:hypothetical protein [Aquimarina sp. AD10]AXT61018.1 hypothetical protein D1816_11895 [Aquimarina sp. AD10]RKM96316.1 hypothetical protein D7033_15630 [Aquimarina sp. AD10]